MFLCANFGYLNISGSSDVVLEPCVQLNGLGLQAQQPPQQQPQQQQQQGFTSDSQQQRGGGTSGQPCPTGVRQADAASQPLRGGAAGHPHMFLQLPVTPPAAAFTFGHPGAAAPPWSGAPQHNNGPWGSVAVPPAPIPPPFPPPPGFYPGGVQFRGASYRQPGAAGTPGRATPQPGDLSSLFASFLLIKGCSSNSHHISRLALQGGLRLEQVIFPHICALLSEGSGLRGCSPDGITSAYRATGTPGRAVLCDPSWSLLIGVALQLSYETCMAMALRKLQVCGLTYLSSCWHRSTRGSAAVPSRRRPAARWTAAGPLPRRHSSRAPSPRPKR